MCGLNLLYDDGNGDDDDDDDDDEVEDDHKIFRISYPFNSWSVLFRVVLLYM